MIQNNHSIYNSNIRFAFCSVDFSRLKSSKQTLYRSIDLSNMMRFCLKKLSCFQKNRDREREKKREREKNKKLYYNNKPNKQTKTRDSQLY